MIDDADDGIRHSQAETASLIQDEDETARREVANALRQIDMVQELVDDWNANDRKFRLRPSTFLQLHRSALEGISELAGTWRPAGISIGKSEHEPPGAHLVSELIEDLCDYVNDNWETATPIRLAAYTLWRINWIHPFVDGNGRTARAVSYLVLSAKVGYRLPGTNTIPEQIVRSREQYYKALECADAAWKEETVDVSEMEQILESMLATQLISVLSDASGNDYGGKLGS